MVQERTKHTYKSNKRKRNMEIEQELDALMNPQKLPTNISQERILELFDLIQLVSLPPMQKGMAMAMLPLVRKAIQSEESEKLHSFMTCLSEMLRGALDSASSQQEYEMIIETQINSLQELFRSGLPN